MSMIRPRLHWLPALLLVAGSLWAGCGPNHETAEAPPPSPYAGEEVRTVKALSPEEVDGLRTGQGLGYAMAAELNHYPGPRHVLDLAEALSLSDDQRARTQALFEQMQADAVPLGEQIVAKEIELDRLFAHQQASPEAVQRLLREISALEADLRFVHLNAHLALKDVFTAEQTMHYDRLRGYGTQDAPSEHGEHHGH